MSTLSLDSLICCSITIRKYWVLQPLQKSHYLGERIKSKWLYNRLYISFARVLNKLGRILSVFHFLCYFLLFCFLQVQRLASSVFKAIIWISNHIVSKNNSILEIILIIFLGISAFVISCIYPKFWEVWKHLCN